MPRVSKSKLVPKTQTTMQQQTVQQQPSLFGSVTQGFGFGMGSSLAHNMFDSKIASAPSAAPAKPDDDKKIQEFKNCMEKSYNDFAVCKQHLDSVTQI